MPLAARLPCMLPHVPNLFNLLLTYEHAEGHPMLWRLCEPAGESVETGAITLDMQKMSRVDVAADHNSAWVEAGAQMGK